MDAPKSVAVTPELHRYVLEHSAPLDAVQQRLIERTAELGGVRAMQVAPEQGMLLTLLTRLVGARRAVEVGTFTGYSSLCIARGLTGDGTLLCCDVSEEWTAIAREAWTEAGVADQIELRIGPAADTLRALPPEPGIDLAFIDADKGGYRTYWDELVPRVRPGGLLLVDNVLWSGRVVDPEATDDDTQAIRAFNEHAAGDDRVELVVLPVADGLTVAMRR
jgi:caffeoyl-CoA O-methyltransferase